MLGLSSSHLSVHQSDSKVSSSHCSVNAKARHIYTLRKRLHSLNYTFNFYSQLPHVGLGALEAIARLQSSWLPYWIFIFNFDVCAYMRINALPQTP